MIICFDYLPVLSGPLNQLPKVNSGCSNTNISCKWGGNIRFTTCLFVQPSTDTPNKRWVLLVSLKQKVSLLDHFDIPDRWATSPVHAQQNIANIQTGLKNWVVERRRKCFASHTSLTFTFITITNPPHRAGMPVTKNPGHPCLCGELNPGPLKYKSGALTSEPYRC